MRSVLERLGEDLDLGLHAGAGDAGERRGQLAHAAVELAVVAVDRGLREDAGAAPLAVRAAELTRQCRRPTIAQSIG